MKMSAALSCAFLQSVNARTWGVFRAHPARTGNVNCQIETQGVKAMISPSALNSLLFA